MSYNTLEINKLKSRANELFMKIKFGSRLYYDALKLFKNSINTKSEPEQIRILKQIIYMLEKK